MLTKKFNAFTCAGREEMALVHLHGPQRIPAFRQAVDEVVGYVSQQRFDEGQIKSAEDFVRCFDGGHDGEVAFIPQSCGAMVEKIKEAFVGKIENTTSKRMITEQGGLMAFKKVEQGTWIFFFDGETDYTPLKSFLAKAKRTKADEKAALGLAKGVTILDVETAKKDWDWNTIWHMRGSEIWQGNLCPDYFEEGTAKAFFGHLVALGYDWENDVWDGQPPLLQPQP